MKLNRMRVSEYF